MKGKQAKDNALKGVAAPGTPPPPLGPLPGVRYGSQKSLLYIGIKKNAKK